MERPLAEDRRATLPTRPTVSDAGRNLKVGAHVQRKTPETKYVVVPLYFLAIEVQLVVFVMVSIVWPVSCLLFIYSWCPRSQPFVKVRGTRVAVPHGVGATY